MKRKFMAFLFAAVLILSIAGMFVACGQKEEEKDFCPQSCFFHEYRVLCLEYSVMDKQSFIFDRFSRWGKKTVSKLPLCFSRPGRAILFCKDFRGSYGQR